MTQVAPHEFRLCLKAIQCLTQQFGPDPVLKLHSAYQIIFRDDVAGPCRCHHPAQKGYGRILLIILERFQSALQVFLEDPLDASLIDKKLIEIRSLFSSFEQGVAHYLHFGKTNVCTRDTLFELRLDFFGERFTQLRTIFFRVFFKGAANHLVDLISLERRQPQILIRQVGALFKEWGQLCEVILPQHN